jgi:hypothetical protein
MALVDRIRRKVPVDRGTTLGNTTRRVDGGLKVTIERKTPSFRRRLMWVAMKPSKALSQEQQADKDLPI